MSRRITYVTGYNEALLAWETGGDFEWALMVDYVQDETTQVMMDDVVAAEFTDASYSRLPMTTPTRDIILPVDIEGPGVIALRCDTPSWGVLLGGEVATSAVLLNVQTNDADSPLVASYPVGYTANGINPANFLLSLYGPVAASTVCITPP